jgi:hypothetical protein
VTGLPWRPVLVMLVCLAAMAGSTPALHAQGSVFDGIGGELRWKGDTIWRDRDTTSTRTIYRGDTVTRTMFLNGRLRVEQRYVVRGDVGSLLSIRDSAGRTTSSAALAERSVPFSTMVGERSMIEGALRQREMSAQMAGRGLSMERPEAARAPGTRERYQWTPNTVIEQIGDTVRYIRGCSAAPPVDTTVYLLFASDSARRLAPSPRTFDRHMARAVRADMDMVVLRTRVASRAPDMTGVPGPSHWPCDGRASGR